MNSDSQYCSCSCDFETRYAHHAHPAMRELEKYVLGCDYGGTSWTTSTQADDIPAALGLKAGVRMLEIGAGTGWPGVYLARTSGCDVTLLDLPVNALRDASERASEEGLGGSTKAVAASGAALPFVAGSFRAICHSDVLCCLPEKLEMLQECRRVVKKGVGMLFFVIAPAHGLEDTELKEALETGPPFVGVPDDYGALLSESGWKILERTDLTDEYLKALRRLVKGLEEGKDTLQDVMGQQGYADHLEHRRRQVASIERGLLERELFLAKAV